MDLNSQKRDSLQGRKRERLAVRRLRDLVSQERDKLDKQIKRSLETVQLMDQQKEELRRMLLSKRLANNAKKTEIS